MKLTTLCLCAGLMAQMLPAAGQNADGIRTDSLRIVPAGATVGVRVRMEVPKRSIRHNYTLRYTPVLFGSGREKQLLSIAFTGDRKRLSDERKVVVEGLLRPAEMEGHVGTVVYETSVPYAHWMSEGPLGLTVDRCLEGYTQIEELEGFLLLEDIRISHPWPIYTPPLAVPDTASLAGGELLRARAMAFANEGRYAEAVDLLAASGASEALLTGVWRMACDSVLRTAIFPRIALGAEGECYTFSLPAVAVQSQLSDAGDTLRARVQFAVRKTHIDTLAADVVAELDRVVEAVVAARDASGTLPRIAVSGSSSPEGAVSLNRRLAAERAASVKEWLCDALERRGVTMPDSLFDVSSIGADWAGLRAMVEASDMEYRTHTLRLLDETPEQERFHALWALKWGVPYTYVYKNFFPRLRNAAVVSVVPECGDTAGEVLSAAVARIAAGDYAGARELLMPLSDDPRAVLPLAVGCALAGDMENAKIYTGRLE